jgi:hypothetical protein
LGLKFLYAHFRVDNGTIPMVAGVATASTAAEGKELKLWLDARRLHLFDPEAGARIGPG